MGTADQGGVLASGIDRAAEPVADLRQQFR